MKSFKKFLHLLLAPAIFHDYLEFKKKLEAPAGGGATIAPRFALRAEDFYLQPADKTENMSFDGHYVYHTAWAARVIAEAKPEKHIDISSSIYFSALVSAFVPIEFYDYRPADIRLPNLESKKGDLTALPFPSGSIRSLSCMHTIEHVGLGRYGDPIDPEGDIKACRELGRVTAPGGSLLFATPMGEEARIQFNAHRVYTYDLVIALFPGFKVKEFALIPQHDERLIRNASPELLKGEKYACGCFWLVKE